MEVRKRTNYFMRSALTDVAFLALSVPGAASAIPLAATTAFTAPEGTNVMNQNGR